MSIERRIWQASARGRTLFYGAVALSFLASALWLGVAAVIGVTVNRVFIEHQTLNDVLGLLALLLLLLLARAGLMWASEVVVQRSSNLVQTNLREQLSKKLPALGPVYTRGERTGELVHAAVQGIEALDEYISQFQPARLLAGLVPVMVFAVILLLDPWTLPILLFAGPVLLILLALIGGRARDLTTRRYLEMAWMSAHFLDMLQGLPTLKMFGRSREQAQTIETISRHYGNSTMDVLRTAFQTSLVLEWGATAATALVAIEVSVRLMNGVLPFERALIVLLLTPEFFLPLRQLALKYHAGTAGKTAAEQIFGILDTPAAGTALNQTPKPVPATFDIAFENVFVAYDRGERAALNGFSLKIPHAQTVALVGATGAGKTTVANLLLRFVEPAQGNITVNGTPLKEIAPTAWRKQVAWVSQHPHLFLGTVAENLRLAKPDATDAELVAAARAAQADEFIARLPQGYATPLGEGGARLSGGQRQRLALARAFLQDAPFLILDEVSSHLDEATEDRVRLALVALRRNRTVLIITHRLALAQDADLVARMEHGRIVEQGSPALLLRSNGSYGGFVPAYGGGGK